MKKRIILLLIATLMVFAFFSISIAKEFEDVPKHSWGLDGEEYKSKTNRYVFTVDKSTEILIPNKNVKKLFVEEK